MTTPLGSHSGFFSTLALEECLTEARRHVDELVGRAVATLGEDATEDLRDVARLARALDDNLAGAVSMLKKIAPAKKEGAT